MPQKNTIKIYIDGGFYHIYNRGVEKRKIFKDSKDYGVFLSYVKECLQKPKGRQNLNSGNLKSAVSKKSSLNNRKTKNYFNKMELLCYCLMPNHFHLLIKQENKDVMESFMRSLATRYSMYFNRRYGRVGKLFQGHYKAVLINDENYLLHLSRYIHLNPLEYSTNIENTYTSYLDYLGKRKSKWVNTRLILSFFKKSKVKEFKKINTYKNFVEKYVDNYDLLGKLTLEN